MSEASSGERQRNSNADLDYAKEFWSISNATTGFAIAQNLAFYILVGPKKGELFGAVGKPPGLYVAGVLIVAAAVAYGRTC